MKSCRCRKSRTACSPSAKTPKAPACPAVIGIEPATLMRSTMESRVLIRIAAPLALTVTLFCAEVMGWPAPMRWGALVAMSLAWLVHAWTLLRPALSGAALGEQNRLLGELRTFINGEVKGSRTEIERARELIRESVAKLGGSFEAV